MLGVVESSDGNWEEALELDVEGRMEVEGGRKVEGQKVC